MFKFKRCLSVILAVMMVLTSVTVFAEEQETTTIAPASVTFSDVDPDSIVGNAVAELVPYGIISGYPEGDFRPDAIITRAEVAKVIVTFLKLQNVAVEGVPTGFADVDATSHWAQKFIRLAIDYKIVNGYTDGTFKPDDPVKYSEAVKMIVCALGYGELAVNRTPAGAAWYVGYITQAAELGLLKNIATDKQDEYAPRGIVAILTANALDAKVANNSADQTGGVGVSQGGTTAREEYQKTEKVEGVVVSCSQTSIGGAAVSGSSRYIGILANGEVKICTVPYGTDTMALLGYAVSANIQSNTGDIPIVSTISKTSSNSIDVIEASLIERVTANGISYWESDYSNDTVQVGFESNMSIVYNGKYLGSGAASYISYFNNVKAGNITLISNDGDAEADVAIINDCKIYAVSSQGTDSATKLKKIYALYGGGDFVVPEKTGYVTVNNKGTDVVDTKNFTVSKYDIINLYASEDGTIFNMTVTKNKKSGVVSSISGNTITIGGNEYQFAYNFAEYQGADKPTFVAGSSATVYLDATGKIAAAENVSAAEGTNVYVGYLLDASATGGINGVTEMQVFGMTSGQKGEKIYKVASNVRVDGHPFTDAADILAPLATAHTNANRTKAGSGIGTLPDYGQLIRYTLNKEGKVDSIDTCDPNVVPANDDMVQSLPFNKQAASSREGKYKYVSGRKFLNENLSTVIQLGTSTPVLVIPTDPTKVKEYKNTTYGHFGSNKYYRVEGYCMDDTGTPEYLICYAEEDSGDISSSANIVLAKSVIESGDYVDDVFKGFDLLESGYNFKTGAEISVSAKNTLKSEELQVIDSTNDKKYTSKLFTEIQTGEIFRYSLDDGMVDKIEMVFEIVNGRPVLFGNKGTDLASAADDYNALASVSSVLEAKNKRDIAYDRTSLSGEASIESSTNRIVYGTVIGKSTGDEKRLAVTNVIASDAVVGSDNFDITADTNTFALANNAKIFVIDLTTNDTDDVIISDVSFDEIATVRELRASNGSDADASQVLMFCASGTVRTIAIIKY